MQTNCPASTRVALHQEQKATSAIRSSTSSFRAYNLKRTRLQCLNHEMLHQYLLPEATEENFNNIIEYLSGIARDKDHFIVVAGELLTTLREKLMKVSDKNFSQTLYYLCETMGRNQGNVLLSSDVVQRVMRILGSNGSDRGFFKSYYSLVRFIRKQFRTLVSLYHDDLEEMVESCVRCEERMRAVTVDQEGKDTGFGVEDASKTLISLFQQFFRRSNSNTPLPTESTPIFQIIFSWALKTIRREPSSFPLYFQSFSALLMYGVLSQQHLGELIEESINCAVKIENPQNIHVLKFINMCTCCISLASKFQEIRHKILNPKSGKFGQLIDRIFEDKYLLNSLQTPDEIKIECMEIVLKAMKQKDFQPLFWEFSQHLQIVLAQFNHECQKQEPNQKLLLKLALWLDNCCNVHHEKMKKNQSALQDILGSIRVLCEGEIEGLVLSDELSGTLKRVIQRMPLEHPTDIAQADDAIRIINVKRVHKAKTGTQIKGQAKVEVQEEKEWTKKLENKKKEETDMNIRRAAEIELFKKREEMSEMRQLTNRKNNNHEKGEAYQNKRWNDKRGKSKETKTSDTSAEEDKENQRDNGPKIIYY